MILLTTFSISIPTFANTSPTINRIAGVDRYETASQIAKSGWSQSDYAILAYGENFPDALAAAPLAKKYNAPILLTAANSLPSSTKQTLTDLQVKNVFIIGGTGIISSSIDSELQSMGITVTRIFGQDRYGTAVKLAEQIDNPSTLFVCTGEDYSDALSVAPIAALKQIPIILVPRDSLPDSVKSYISLNNITKTYVIGYSDVVSDNVFYQLPNSERIVGADKYARNIAIDQKFDNNYQNGICIATGEGFADALTGAAYCAKISEPIILINDDSSADTKNYYQQRLANINNVTVFGGTGIIPDSVVQNLQNVVSTTSEVPVGEWDGTYYNSLGKMSLVLNVSKIDDNGDYQAIFNFGPSDETENAPFGSFKMLGTYDQNTQTLNLKEDQWIQQPTDWVMVDLSGTIDISSNSYSGNVIEGGSTSGKFMVTKETNAEETAQAALNMIPGKWKGEYIVQGIRDAKFIIWAAVAWFSNEAIYRELLAKKKQGLNIRLIISDEDANQKLLPQIQNTFDVVVIPRHGWNEYNRMHDKFCIVDLEYVMHGSYNWTATANYNEETLATALDREFVKKFADEFMRMYAENHH